MKVYLHIGMSKAGSTAIQSCLAQHEAALLEAGVCFPASGRFRNAHYDLVIQLKKGRVQAARKTMEAMLDEAREAGSQTVIVSVEGLWVLPDAAVAQIADMLREHEVEVVFYLRRPDTYLTSAYRQRIKRVQGTQSEHAYAQEPLARLRYDRVLSRWEKRFTLRVRSYERERADLVGDFARATEISDVVHCPPQQINVTPNDGSIRLMRVANRLAPTYQMSMRVNRRLLAWQRLFAWMPPLNDAPLVARARAAAATWDQAVMQRHLTPEDLAAITPPLPAQSRAS